MQESPLKEIEKLRREEDLKIFQRNKNRYAVIIRESESLTAYFFSTPIYRLKERTLVQLNFTNMNGTYIHQGSNAMVKVTDQDVKISNELGKIRIFFNQQSFAVQNHSLVSSNMQIIPTLNGIALKQRMSGQQISFHIQTENVYEIRSNSKYVAFMREKFLPFATFGLLPGLTAGRCIPTQMEVKKVDDRNYQIFIFHTAAEEIFFELNLYEGKLFQDTTVESYKDYENNAFGPITFLGNTEIFGQQWLYSRPDLSRLSDWEAGSIRRVRLHIPVYGKLEGTAAAYPLTERFCSFGSMWNNKIQPVSQKREGSFENGYQSFELTDFITTFSGGFKRTEGMVLKNNGPGYTVMATGDNYYTPQILEINYIP